MGLILRIIGLVLIALALAAGILFVFKAAGLLILAVMAFFYGWIGFAFLHYRYVRQEELLHVLATAAEGNVPLAPALWAYLRDRPRDTWRQVIEAAILDVVLFAVLPGFFLLFPRDRYDRKVYRVAAALEHGRPLYAALRVAPGVAARETLLAAAVGESTGQLGLCLRNAPRWRLAPLWLEAAPRLIYPLMLLVGVNVIFTFLMIFIIPKYQKIFADLHVALPESSELIFSVGQTVYSQPGLIVLGTFAAVVLVSLPIAFPAVRWHFPLIGGLYRMHTRGRVLRMLALLLDAGKPLPRALVVLAESGYFPPAVAWRIEWARLKVEQGEPLADSLHLAGLLPASMIPLLNAATRARNVSWALTELGDALGKRSVRTARRIVMAVFPITVFVCGVLVGFVAFGMFVPLVTLISEVGS